MDSNLTKKQDNSPVARLKRVLNADSVQLQFKNALKENSGLFIASLIDLYASDNYLQQCDPNAVIMEALKAATLKLPINKSLGFAYIVPFKNNKLQKVIPTFIIGYKGYLQLAQRSGVYRFINADCIYAGEKAERDRLTGEVLIMGEPSEENADAIAYFAHIETVNGFKKTEVWPREKIEAHAKEHSKSYHSDSSPWKKHFNAMAIKTVVRSLLSKHAILSVDMERALIYDATDTDNDVPQLRPSGFSANQVTYDATKKPPVKEPEQPQGDESKSAFEKDSGVDTGSPPPAESAGPVDEYGVPLSSPMASENWYNTRKGKDDKSTGFAKFINDNHQHLKDVTPQSWSAMVQKYTRLYGDEFPYDKNGVPIEESAMDNDEQVQNGNVQMQIEETQALLDTPAAKQLAEIAKKHPEQYKQVVAGRVPESVQQIIDWMEQINQLVVEARKNKSE